MGVISYSSVTVTNVNDGQSGQQGVSVVKVVPEYTVSTSTSSVPIDAIWTETKPLVDSTTYLWTRERTDLSDNTSSYSDAVCDVVISGIISRVDYNEQQITNKVWQSDITGSINTYDGSTVQTIRDRVTSTETGLTGVTTRVADVESTTTTLGTRMTSAESSITQNAGNIALKVDKNGVISSINMTPENITIDASKLDLVGNVSFSMFDSSTRETINSIRDKATQGAELIVGTQLQSTFYWTGASATIGGLTDGMEIKYWLPFSAAGVQPTSSYSYYNGSTTVTETSSGAVLNLTLSDETETGNIPIFYSGIDRLTTHYPYGNVIHLIYRENVRINNTDSTYYIVSRGFWCDSNYNSDSHDTIVANTVVAGVNGVQQYSLIMRDSATTWSSLTTDYGTGEKTFGTSGFYYDKIWYHSSDINYSANSSTDGSIYESYYYVDLRYTFNIGNNALVARSPVYLVGTIDSADKKFYPTSPYLTQTEPSSVDNKVYLFLGIAYDGYRIFLNSEHLAYMYYNGKFQPYEQVLSIKAQEVADSAYYWVNSTGTTAASIISNWATDASLASTTIKGGLIATHTITSTQLATDAIMSNNYLAGSTGSPYSSFGSFLDLTTGNFYTPNFGVQSSGTTGAYINGQIIATSGRIGEDTNTSWTIGSYTDYDQNTYGAMIANGDAFIQSGKWMISADSINTQWYDQNLQITHVYDNATSTYYDYGMTVPKRNSTDAGYVSANVSENFLYIRKHASTIPSSDFPTDWNYIFRVDKDGMIWIDGLSLDQRYAAITDVGSIYLPKTGGTITGDLIVTGTITGTVGTASGLTHSLSINGVSFDGTANVSVGAIGASYGGTGQTSLVNSANVLLNALSADSSTPVDADYYISQYVSGGTTTITYHRRPMSALWNYVKSKLANDTTTLDGIYIDRTGDTVTGNFTITGTVTATSFSGSLSGNATSATSAGRLTNAVNLTVGNTVRSFDGSSAVSWSKADISGDATSSASGWMSASDKEKLDSINISTIGTVTAGSILGTAGISVTTNDGIATVSHTNSITAGATTGTETSTLSNGGSFSVPKITYDAQGHITAVTNNVLTLPSNSGSDGTDGDGNVISTTYAKLSGATFTGPVYFGQSNVGFSSSNGTKHGYVQGDLALYSHMTGANNRGWIFKNDTSGIASISNLGNAVFSGSVTVGGNTTNTSGCELVFDNTLNCLNFVFS